MMSFIKKKQEQREHDESRFIRLGWIVIVVGLFGFLLWAALAPLDQGVPATGTVIVSGHRKVVQAPISGTVATILVKEGETVKANTPLLRLNTTIAEAKYNRLRTNYITSLLTEARLVAERDNMPFPAMPETLMAAEFREEAHALIAFQQELYNARTQTLRNEIAANEQAIGGIDEQLSGLVKSLTQKKRVNHSLVKQLDETSELVSEGFLPRNRYMEVERQQADILSQIESMSGEIGQARKRKEELGQRIRHLLTNYQQEVRSQLVEARTRLSDYHSELQSAEFELKNSTILAPAEGRVISLSVFNPGATVTPADRLMEIVPLRTPLIVDARLPAHLIDKVHPNLQVKMIFSAFNQNKTPVIPGQVSLVSADRLTDKTTGEHYYQIQVSVTQAGTEMLAKNDIRPGMPVEVLIRTGSRTMLNYLLKPIFDRASTALMEE